MKKLILLLSCTFLVGCSKGKVVEKKYYPAEIKKLEYIEDGKIKYTTEMYSEEHTILVDESGNKNRIIVNKETYDKLSVGDEY